MKLPSNDFLEAMYRANRLANLATKATIDPKILSAFQQTTIAPADIQKLLALTDQNAAIISAYQQNAAIFQRLAAMPDLTALIRSNAYRQITTDIYPAMEYLQQEHKEVYEQVADLLPDVPSPPQHRKRIRTLKKAQFLSRNTNQSSRTLKKHWGSLSSEDFFCLLQTISLLLAPLDDSLKNQLSFLLGFLALLFICTHRSKKQNRE